MREYLAFLADVIIVAKCEQQTNGDKLLRITRFEADGYGECHRPGKWTDGF